ncbi:Vesicle-associated membrane protein [Trichuris trichiura]|uniref:Major sperm protein n=1 Tax=Trichuris trichiura TaxID=36087 RepID=A0A077ZFY7_TRITR|nr:Vesicle-associated membrane protein [Trichuris trichiura]
MRVIEVEPDELLILGKHYYQRLQHFTLKNLSNQRIAYKVRATHPNNYIVKPAVGFLDPKDGVLIRVLLYAYTDEVFMEKHYLEVLALPVGLEDPVSSDQFWVEAVQKNIVPTSLKLRIRFSKASSKRFMRSRHNATTEYLLKTLEKVGEGSKESRPEPKPTKEPLAEEQVPGITKAEQRQRRNSDICAPKTPVLFLEMEEDERCVIFHDFVGYLQTHYTVLTWVVCVTLVLIIVAGRK